MTPRRLTLEQWIDAAGKDPDRGVLTAINCYHMTAGGLGNEIHGVVFELGRPWDPKQVAAVLRGKAEAFSQDLAGAQTFKVQAYYGSDEPKGFMHFVITGLAEFPNGVTEEATPKGLAQQGMRWGEAIVQRTFGMQALLFEQSQHLIRELRADRDEYRADARESFGIIREMLQEKVKLDHDSRMAEAKFLRDTEERRKLITFLPAILNTILGRKIVDVGTADTAIIETAALHIASMSDDARGKLFAQLPQELVSVLMPRILEIAEAHAKAAEGAAMLRAAEREDTRQALETDESLSGGRLLES